MIVYRVATIGDAEAVAAFVNAAYRGESSKQGWTTEADFLDGQRTDPAGVAEMIETPGARIELAHEGEGLVGCVYLRREESGACYLGMLTVAPGLQGGGVGKRVLEHSESLAREWGCRRMRMNVIHLRSELIAFYERRGYRRTGAAEPFPEHDPKFGLPRVKGLTFVELEKAL